MKMLTAKFVTPPMPAWLVMGTSPLAQADRLSRSERQYLDQLHSLLTEEEHEQLSRLPGPLKVPYVDQVLKAQVPECQENHQRHVRQAEEQFSRGRLRGSRTDRGRIFIILGEPDERRVEDREVVSYPEIVRERAEWKRYQAEIWVSTHPPAARPGTKRTFLFSDGGHQNMFRLQSDTLAHSQSAIP